MKISHATERVSPPTKDHKEIHSAELAKTTGFNYVSQQKVRRRRRFIMCFSRTQPHSI